MNTNEKIKKQEQKIARLEKSISLEKIKKRRADTRQKIEFGGLVIKANMNKVSKAVLLGALIDAQEQITTSPEMKVLFQRKGEAAFLGFKD